MELTTGEPGPRSSDPGPAGQGPCPVAAAQENDSADPAACLPARPCSFGRARSGRVPPACSLEKNAVKTSRVGEKTKENTLCFPHCYARSKFKFTKIPVRQEVSLWKFPFATYLEILREAMLVVRIELPDVFQKLLDGDGLHVIWGIKGH